MRRRNRTARNSKLTARRHSSAWTASRRLTREALEDRRLLAILTFDIDAIDDVTLRLNATDVEVVETGNLANVLATNPLADTDRLVINGDADANTLTVDSSFFATGLEVDFVGTAATGDVLAVVGSGSESAVFMPDPSAGVGTVDVDGQVTNFDGPVDITGMAVATWSSNELDEMLTIANGMDFDTASMDALRIVGTSGGLPIEPSAFFANAEVTIETTTVDGDDLVTVNSADNNHNNADLTIVTGVGLDAVNLDGDVELIMPASTLRVTTQDIEIGGQLRVAALVDLNAGDGAIVDVSPSEDANIVGAAAALTASMGIGSADDLNTQIESVAFSNATSSDVRLTNDGDLTIDDIGIAMSTAVADLMIVTSVGEITDAVPVAVGGTAQFTARNAGDAIFLDTLMVEGMIGLATNGPAGNVTIINDNTIDFANVDVGGDLTAESLSGDINVGTAISVTADGSVTFESDANITIAAGASLTANQGSISLFGDAHDASGGTTVDLFGDLVSPAAVIVEGNSNADIFNISPDDDTPIDVDGMSPLAGVPGDTLNLDLTGVTDANVSLMGVGATSISSTSHAIVTTQGLETFDVVNGTFGLLVETDQVDLGAGTIGNDGSSDRIQLELDSTGSNLSVDVNSAPIFVAESSDIRHVEVIGSSDDDTLSVGETTGGLPSFPGDLSTGGQSTSGHRNTAFTTSGLTNVADNQNIGIHFDARTGATDQLQFGFTSTQNVTYFSDADTTTSSGNVNIEAQVNISFTGLTPLVLEGAGGTLTVDASSTPTTTSLTVADDLADVAGTGGNMISGDGGFETTFFSGFDSVHVRGGDGDETITITTLDSTPSDGGIALSLITLDGNNTAGSDTGNDILEVESLPETIAAELIGGAGNDTFMLGDAGNSLDGLLGTIMIDGGDENPVPTSESVTAKDLTITVDVDEGDTLIIKDQGDTDDNTYTLTDSTFDRTGIGQVMLVEIETIELLTTIGIATVEVIDTPDNSKTTIATQDRDDVVTINDTGAASILLVNTAGGMDTITINTTGMASVIKVDSGSDDDAFTVNDTGETSGVQLDGDDGADTFTVQSSGSSSAVRINAGAGDDIVTVNGTGADSRLQIDGGAGNDMINMAGTGVGSASQLNGGADNDTFMLGDAGNSLDGLLGTIMIDGDDENPVPTSESVTAKDLTITVDVDEGDTLIIKDQGDTDDNTYTLTDSTFDRTGSGQVMFTEIETIELLTTMGIATVEVTDTPDNSKTTIATQDRDDVVTINDTGAASILLVNTAGGMDTITINSTGAASVIKVDSGSDDDAFAVNDTGETSGVQLDGDDGADTFTVQSSGSSSAVRINASAGDDIVTVNGTGADSRLQIDGGAGNDMINMAGTGVGSASQLNGGADNDTFMLGDAGNSLDGLLGTIMIDGDDENPVPTSESVTAKDLTITVDVDEGDTLIIKDQGDTDDNTYTLTDSTFDRTGSGQVMFVEIETIELLTTMGIATVEVTDTPDNSKTTIATQDRDDMVTINATGAASILLVNTAGGMDTITINTTGMGSVIKVDSGSDDDAFTVNDTGETSGVQLDGDDGADTFTVQSSDSGSAVRINAGAGDDIVTVNGTGADSRLQIDGGAGNDMINMAGTGVGSASQLNGGADNDTFMLGDAGNSLDGLLGTIMIDGDDENPVPTSESVTAKDLTITVDVDEGDTLIIKDQGDTDDNTYTLTDSTFDRTGSGQVMFVEIETIELLTTMGIATVEVTDTPDNSKTTIATQDRDDMVTINATGAASILLVNTAGGMDTITINTTGMASVIKVDSGSDDDAFTVNDTGETSGVQLDGDDGADTFTVQSSGSSSAVRINAGAGDDIVTVNGTGADSRLQIDGGAGNDMINMAGTGVGSASQLNGGADNDTFMLGDAGNSLDGLLGTIMIDGDDENPVPTSESVTAKDLTITVDVDEGDTLIIKDQGDTDDNTYTLTDSTFDRTGSGQVMFTEIETIELLTTMGIATVEVTDTPDNSKTTIATQDRDDVVTINDTGAASILLVNTAGGMDTITINSTGAASVIKVDSGSDDDAFAVNDTGETSGVQLDGDDGADTFTVQSSGSSSAVRINAGAGDDIVTVNGTGADSRLQIDGGAGNDMINMAGTGVGSASQLNGGADNDTFMLGDAGNSLDGLLGTIMIDGDDENPVPTSESVTAKDLTITVDVDEGDTLIIKDQGDTDDNTYTLTDSTFDRTGSGQVMFVEIETIELLTTMGIATVEVTDTPDNSKTTVTTQDRDDVVTINATGAASILLVNTAGGMDTITVNITGTSSVTKVDSGSDNDTFTVNNTENQSGLEVHGQDDRDTFKIHRTGMESATKVEGGADNDTIDVSSPMGSLSAIAGALQVRGGDNTPINEDSTRIRDEGFITGDEDGTAPWDKNSRYDEDDSPQATGDTLNVFDTQWAADAEYEIAPLDGTMEKNSGTIQRIGGPCVWFESTESFNMQTGIANDLVEVFLPPMRDELPQIITVNGGTGQNQLTILGSAAKDTIIIGDLVAMPGEIRAPFEVQNVRFLYVLTGGENDVVHNDTGSVPATTPAKSLVDGGIGDDILVGGPEVDSLFGGLGADAIFGDEGSDFLFADVDIEGTIIPEAGDVVFGNRGFGNDSGFFDSGVVLVPPNANSTDFVDEIENLFEDGAQKGVWSWLLARFPEFDLEPNDDGTFSSPEIEQLVDESLSQFPATDIAPPIREQCAPHEEFDAMDVNRDGFVAPLDAMIIINALHNVTPSSSVMDINRDGQIAPIDALMVINYLNEAHQSATATPVRAPVGIANDDLVQQHDGESEEPQRDSATTTGPALIRPPVHNANWQRQQARRARSRAATDASSHLDTPEFDDQLTDDSW